MLFIQPTSSECYGIYSSLLSGNSTQLLQWFIAEIENSLAPGTWLTLPDICFVSHSHKFGKKLTYVNYLAELREHLNYDQLIIPPDVLRYVVLILRFALL